MKNKHALAYIKFLSNVANDTTQFPILDPSEERMLNHLGTTWHRGKNLTVSEAIHALPSLSPSTSHKRLKMLRKKDLIDLEVDQIDNRIKYIVHTDLTDKYFSHLGQCLAKCCDG
ncbi:MAG: hypothetical protein NTW57_05115 [Methylophilales bacterium]|nr:hypothetical protein [Methylophilales bacterium]